MDNEIRMSKTNKREVDILAELKKQNISIDKINGLNIDDIGKKLDKSIGGSDDIINKVKNDDIILENSKQKGNFAEIVQDYFYEGTGKNLNRISKDRVTSLDDKIHQGIDGIYEDSTIGPPKFVISEAKYGTSKLSTLKDGTRQMSNKWIVDRLENVVGAQKAKKILLEMTLNPDNVQYTLINVDSKGNVVESFLNGKKPKGN